MTEPVSPGTQQLLLTSIQHDEEATEQDHRITPPPPFEPIYTLVKNTTTQSTHHPHVHYIFSDDDPDLLTQALSEQHDANIHESASDPSLNNRAVLLDLARDDNGGYSVAWASSLSPSWAVLDAQVSQISPPSSDGGGGNGGVGGAGEGTKKPDRLMLRIEGVEGCGLSSETELRVSGERSGPGSGTGSRSGSGSGQRDREKADAEDYGGLVDEFEKRMSMLRKVVDASEERRQKVPIEARPEGGPIQTADGPSPGESS